MEKSAHLNLKILPAIFVLAFGMTSCNNEEAAPISPGPGVALQNYSVTPPLIKNLPTGAQAFAIIGSDDRLPQSPNFVFGGSADGAGLLSNADGSFTVIVNHEDNYAVSRLKLDRNLQPLTGEYIMSSDQGRWRLCSATLATPAEHGFGPLYLTCGESGIESMIHAVDPNGAPNSSRLLPALGKWSAENAVPLPAGAYPGRTLVIIGDDDSGTNGGQLVLYLGNSTGDLDNGSLYVLARADDNIREIDLQEGTQYTVVFRKIDNQTNLTGQEIDAKAAELKAIAFGRVEDIDYRKGAGNEREIYFIVTGQNNTGVNADYSRTKYGRVYRLLLNQTDPTQGTIELILTGDDRSGLARQFQNPDNICVTANYFYAQEDPNGYGDETHDSYIYQYRLAGGTLNVIMELDHHRGVSKYNVGGDSRFGSWEYGTMIDISDHIGVAGAFLICIQPHTWTGDQYRGIDGGTLRPNENQASQIVVVTGLPR